MSVRLLRRKSVLAVLLIVTALNGYLLYQYLDRPETIQTKAADTVVTTSAGTIGTAPVSNLKNYSTDTLLVETNLKRAESSLKPIAINASLNASAQAKCEDMAAKRYFAHNSPDGIAPWEFIRAAGYKDSELGENLAMGYFDSRSALEGWMNSPGHRKNILKSNWQDIGFGICETKTPINGATGIIVVQHFGIPTRTYAGPPPSSAPKYKPYVPSVCHNVPIPYKTNYTDVSYLYVGETSSYGGYDGYKKICGPDSTGYTPPPFTYSAIDKTVYVGTKPRP